MILPCPAFAAPFFPPLVDADDDEVGNWTFLAGWGGGSSSEKDSHAGSSFVTGGRVSSCHLVRNWAGSRESTGRGKIWEVYRVGSGWNKRREEEGREKVSS